VPLRHYKGDWDNVGHTTWSGVGMQCVHEQLGTMQKRIEVSKCEATKKQETLMEARTRGNWGEKITPTFHGGHWILLVK
jgi:hypothetical protein